MPCKNRLYIALAAAVFVIAAAGTAAAQMSNKPFSFKNSPGGGPGMSQGGRQAIINEKLFDSTPDNLQRDADGALVDAVKGPGHTVIVFSHGTASSIPGFHGTDFRGGNTLMQVGVFNPFFASSGADDSGFAYSHYQTAAIIDSWTMSIAQGNTPYSYYGGGSSVDSWTTFVNSLNGLNATLGKEP